MCGIVGYIGEKKATPILLDALEKLEYRGYDSAGIALVSGKGINIFKTRGRIADLQKIIDAAPADDSCVGIGHTRWATHGEPSDLNAHPHRSKSGRVAVVHNGIVENYLELRQFLMNTGTASQPRQIRKLFPNLLTTAITATLLQLSALPKAR